LNKLNDHVVAGDTKSAANLLKSIGRFFSEEIKADQDGAKSREIPFTTNLMLPKLKGKYIKSEFLRLPSDFGLITILMESSGSPAVAK
jgi:hypothetical protein